VNSFLDTDCQFPIDDSQTFFTNGGLTPWTSVTPPFRFGTSTGAAAVEVFCGAYGFAASQAFVYIDQLYLNPSAGEF
jgi:hypothetical protein